MVKYIFRSILVLLVLSQYSCNTKEIIEDKSYISYFNYLDTVQVPYDISGLLTEIKADSLILKYDLKTQSNILLKGKLKDFFLNEYIKSTNNFDKFFNGEYSNEWKCSDFDQMDILSNGYINLKNNVKGLIVTIKIYDRNKKESSRKLVLFNIKDDKILSMIKLSSAFFNTINSLREETLFYHGIFTFVHNGSVAFDSSNYYLGWKNVRTFKDFLIKLDLKKENEDFTFYSTYRIDKIGFVFFIKCTDKNISKFLMSDNNVSEIKR